MNPLTARQRTGATNDVVHDAFAGLIFSWDGTILIGDYSSDGSDFAAFQAFALTKDGRKQAIPWQATTTDQGGSPMQVAW